MGTRFIPSVRCSKGWRFFLPFGALFFASVLVAIAPGVVFELDGDSVTGNQNPAHDDWNLLNGTTGFNGSDGNSVPGTRTFVKGDAAPAIFTGGGSKDPLDINKWAWKPSTTGPDKDALTNGYAAEYIDPVSTHKIFVFGADRFAVNGDANIGIWFFQNSVTNQGDGSFGPGLHKNGDIFAVSAFTGGGSNPIISVYLWDSSCNKADSSTPTAGQCAAANLRLKFNSAPGSTCNTADFACAATNSAPISVSWPYSGKNISGNTVTQPQANAFFEGGIDITELFGVGNEPCISSFLEETRASQTPSSTLKDFLIGSFDTCKVTISKTCACDLIIGGGSSFEYAVGGTVTNSGAATLHNVEVTDNAGTPSDANDDLTFTCGDILAGASKKWGSGAGAGDCTASGGNTYNSTDRPSKNIATVSAWTGVNKTGVNKTASTSEVTCSVSACPLNPSISVNKDCTTAVQVLGSNVVVRVDFLGEATNDGNETLTGVNVAEDNDNDDNANPDVPSLSLTKFDAQNNNKGTCVAPCSLAPGEKVTFSGFYFPKTFTGCGKNDCTNPPDGTNDSTGKAAFTDKVIASGTGLKTQTAKSNSATKTCNLCPYGVCLTDPNATH